MPEITFTLDVEDYAAPGMPAGTRHHARRGRVPRSARTCEGHSSSSVSSRSETRSSYATSRTQDTRSPCTRTGTSRSRPLTRDAFREDTKRGKALLEDLTGTEIAGFRAPTFSLVRSTEWAVDILTEVGFRYSSSVLPAHSPLFGHPTRPRLPSRWPSGLLELPCPVARGRTRSRTRISAASTSVCSRGPRCATGSAAAHADEILWTYCHPYDFDPEEPFAPRPGLGHLKSRLLWVNRRHMYARIGRLLDLGAASPLIERTAGRW